MYGLRGVYYVVSRAEAEISLRVFFLPPIIRWLIGKRGKGGSMGFGQHRWTPDVPDDPSTARPGVRRPARCYYSEQGQSLPSTSKDQGSSRLPAITKSAPMIYQLAITVR